MVARQPFINFWRMPSEVVAKGLDGQADITDDMFTKFPAGKECVRESLRRLARNWSLAGTTYANAKGIMTSGYTTNDKVIMILKSPGKPLLRFSVEDIAKGAVSFFSRIQKSKYGAGEQYTR
jgi:hypothetical protein